MSRAKSGGIVGVILPASLLHPLCQQFCGQGRGRTVDLPIFRTPVQCPAPVGTVRDLRQNVLAVSDGRPQTIPNETENEKAGSHLHNARPASQQPRLPAWGQPATGGMLNQRPVDDQVIPLGLDQVIPPGLAGGG